MKKPINKILIVDSSFPSPKIDRGPVFVRSEFILRGYRTTAGDWGRDLVEVTYGCGSSGGCDHYDEESPEHTMVLATEEARRLGKALAEMADAIENAPDV